MNGTTKLSNASLEDTLNAIHKATALLLDRHGVRLDDDVLMHEIPGTLFSVAVEANWFPPPLRTGHASDAVTLGDGIDDYEIDKSVRDKFLHFMGESIEFWRSEISGDDIDYSARRREIFDRWRSDGHTLETLAEQARVSPSTVERIKRGAFSYTKRQAESVKAVAAVLQCDWRDLLPRRSR